MGLDPPLLHHAFSGDWRYVYICQVSSLKRANREADSTFLFPQTTGANFESDDPHGREEGLVFVIPFPRTTTDGYK